MINQYLIVGTTWTQISLMGQTIRAWIDQDYDGAIGSMDLRVYSSQAMPIDDDFTKARRLYRLNANEGAFIQSTDKIQSFFWVRAANPGDRALISVEIVAPEISPITLGDTAAIDAFGRLRVSLPRGIFEYQNQYNGATLIWENIVEGAGTVTHQPSESSVILSTGDTLEGSKAIRQTRQYYRYRPGRSLFLIFTGVLGLPQINSCTRAGYFDDRNGVFFMSDELGYSVVIRSDTSGSVVDTVINSADWNVNRLDGTGPNRIDIDPLTAVIGWIDLEWLGVGRVRFGVVSDGIPYVCHAQSHTNVYDKVYMRTANLPIRYEVDNHGPAMAITTLKAICAGLSVEGDGDPEQGYDFAADTGDTQLVITATKRAMISIRPKATFYGQINRSGFSLKNINILTGTQALRWELRYNPTVIGGSWVSVNTESTVEYNITSTGYSGGIMVDSGYLPASNQSKSSLEQVLNTRYPFALDRSGLNPLNFTVVIQGVGGSGVASAGLTWREFY